jgi:hypothetical protein
MKATGKLMRHCDEYIDDPATPEPLRAFLEFNRRAAIDQIGDSPVLFARHNGTPVRVVMASRFGDVGISAQLEARHGYSKRVAVDDLTHFSDTR